MCYCHQERGFHLERVLAVAKDYQFSAIEKEVIMIKMQKILHSAELDAIVRVNTRSFFIETEIVIIEDIFMILLKTSVQY